MEDLSPWSLYFNTPLDSSLDIPLFDCLDENAMFTDPNNNPYNERVIFHLPADWDDVPEVTAQSKSLPKLDASYLAAISPSSPLLDSFDPSQLTSVAPQIRAPTMVKFFLDCSQRRTRSTPARDLQARKTTAPPVPLCCDTRAQHQHRYALAIRNRQNPALLTPSFPRKSA